MARKKNFLGKDYGIESFDESASINNDNDIDSDTHVDTNNVTEDVSLSDNNYTSTLDESSDFYSDDENTFNQELFIDKLINFFKGLTVRAIIFLVFLSIFIMTIFIVVVSIISSNNKLYNAIIDIPEIVYIGESDNIVVNASAKKDVSSIVTKFESSDDSVISMLNGSVKGPRVYDAMIPVKEGVATINVESFWGNRRLGQKEAEVVVCPKFDSSLVFSNSISVINGLDYDLNIDFGMEKCGEGVTYESSDNSIFTVSKEGKINALHEGSANVIVKKNNMSFNIPVNITPYYIPLMELKIDFSEIKLVKDEIYRITGSFLPSNATSQGLSFSSYDGSVIDVSDNGVITALEEGSTDLIITSSDKSSEKKVRISVYEPLRKDGIEPASVELGVSNVVMNVGKTHKIYYAISPENTRDKRIKWSSSNDDVAVADKNGVIYAKGPGTAVITAKTSNGIEKSISVKVDSLAQPLVSASDRVLSDEWHNDKYTLNVYGSIKGSRYFYGLDPNNVSTETSSIEVNKDGKAIYYFKTCLGDVCSPTISYISKLDTVKPKVLKVEKSNNSASGMTAHIYLEDNGSFVSKWCVVSSNDHTLCQWNSIQLMTKPIVTYVANRKGTYYAFAQDAVGNVSNGFSFKIDDIK